MIRSLFILCACDRDEIFFNASGNIPQRGTNKAHLMGATAGRVNEQRGMSEGVQTARASA